MLKLSDAVINFLPKLSLSNINLMLRFFNLPLLESREEVTGDCILESEEHLDICSGLVTPNILRIGVGKKDCLDMSSSCSNMVNNDSSSFISNFDTLIRGTLFFFGATAPKIFFEKQPRFSFEKLLLLDFSKLGADLFFIMIVLEFGDFNVS
jgi:hypothetical protein